MSSKATLAKLERVFGAERANELIHECMQSAGIKSLESADERLMFARALIRLGGIYDAIGNSIAVQALLEGAKEGETSGTFVRPGAATRPKKSTGAR
ncbi:MAG: hypothetical protein HOW73_26445 [Polyangiaceae bacterium]|nr:hypothetical protein [Polyangiaceae bacterium]